MLMSEGCLSTIGGADKMGPCGGANPGGGPGGLKPAGGGTPVADKKKLINGNNKGHIAVHLEYIKVRASDTYLYYSWCTKRS